MKEERPWFKRIADLILECKTFDVSTNTDGLKTVSQMIAKKMCDELSFGQVVFNNEGQGILDMVKKNLPHAITYLTDDLKIPVYRRLEARYEITTENGNNKKGGGKFVEYITIDADYRDAREATIERIGDLMRRSLGASKRNLEIIAPRRDFNVLVERELKQIE